MAKKSGLNVIAMILLIIGGLNWLATAFDISLVNWIGIAWLIKTIYILVGLAAIYKIFKR